MAGIKAVVEVKQPQELRPSDVPAVVAKYGPIAKAVCKLLILTSGKKTYWFNALTGQPVLDESGKEVRALFDPRAVGSLSPEEQAALVALVEKADYSLSDTNDQFQPIRVLDPSGLAKTVWQKIWINTGKEPGKCLYNVVEILVFKFLSDIGVLRDNYSFGTVVKLLANSGEEDALTHYARIARPRIRNLFPAGPDGTTIINGTIFVNERGEPNMSQALLFGQVVKDFQEYDDQNGSLQYIDRQFKTRVYESFLRQQASIKSLGQYFTPRNVVQSMVRMSNAGSLRPGDSLCDPFCGVGGFLLEAIAENPSLSNEFEPRATKVSPQITIRGYDKGSDEREDELTIILAKANMLIYMSDLLSKYHSEEYLKEFSNNAFNAVFHLLRTNLGTFALVPQSGEDETEKYDLILTNPPYVTSGSASIKAAIKNDGLSAHYPEGRGRGTEALAMQWIISHLKPSGEAFVVVPDGLMNQELMLAYIKSECDVLCVVALPSRTFYATPKKTYILGIRKRKEGNSPSQDTPVCTYLVSEVGESRDARRDPIPANDLSTMESEFQYFRAAPSRYQSQDPRCKILSWAKFDELKNWLVDRAWTEEEKIALGIIEESFEVSPEELRDLALDARSTLDELLAELK
jgi:type I restriction-modification system DNA methylase subunit